MRAPLARSFRTTTSSPRSAAAIISRSVSLACCAMRRTAPRQRKSKKAAEAAFAIREDRIDGLRRRGGVFVDLALLHRAGIETLGGFVAIDELDHRRPAALSP